MLSAASSCSVSSCSSRAQRRRSRSDASMLRCRPSAVDVLARWPSAVAAAARRRPACRRSSSAVKSGPCHRSRSKAARTPTRAAAEARAGTIRPVAAPSVVSSAKRSRVAAVGQPLGLPRAQDVAGDASRRAAMRRPTTSAATSPAAAATTSSSPSRSATSMRARVDEGAPALDEQLEDALELDLAADRPGDRRPWSRARATARSSSSRRARDVRVQARVLDRDRRPVGEHDRAPPRRSRRTSPLGLLGEVEVAPRLAADEDRHAEERVHRGVPERESVGARMVAHVGEPQRLRVADQPPEDAVASRQLADRRAARASSMPRVMKRSSSSRRSSRMPSAA